MLDDIFKKDIMEEVTYGIFRDGYGEMDLSHYLEVINEEFIDNVLKHYKFDFVKKGKGTYEIKEEIILEDDKKEVIEYVNQCIQERGFDQCDELEIDIFGKFDLNPVSIAKIVWDMGYNGGPLFPCKTLIANKEGI